MRDGSVRPGYKNTLLHYLQVLPDTGIQSMTQSEIVPGIYTPSPNILYPPPPSPTF